MKLNFQSLDPHRHAQNESFKEKETYFFFKKKIKITLKNLSIQNIDLNTLLIFY